MAYYRTVVTIEVLSDGTADFDSLEELAYQVVEGDWSGRYTAASMELTREEMIAACLKQHTDPEFFGIAEED